MENPSQNQSSTNQQSSQAVQQPAVPPSNPNKSKLPLIFILIALVPLIFIGATSINLHTDPFPRPSNSLLATPPKSLTTTPTTDPTANWKIHTDDVNNLEIKYPEGWIITSAGSKNVFKTLQDWVINRNAAISSLNKDKIYWKKEIIKNNRNINIEEVSNKYMGRFFVADLLDDSGLIITIQVIPQPKRDASKAFSHEDLKIFDQILSTFKFIPTLPVDESQDQKIDTSSWKTYTNQNMNISIDYPSSWKILDSGTDQYKYETVTLNSSEGFDFVEIVQGSGFGGGSCRGKLIDISTFQGTIKICDLIINATETWYTDNLEAGTLKLKNGDLSIKIVATASSSRINRNTIVKILSTFRFTN